VTFLFIVGHLNIKKKLIYITFYEEKKNSKILEFCYVSQPVKNPTYSSWYSRNFRSREGWFHGDRKYNWIYVGGK